MSVIRIAQFFNLTPTRGTPHLYQNYFVNTTKAYGGQNYSFAPFSAEGTTASLGGENQSMRVLFPNNETVLRLVEASNYNYLSALELTTAWINAADQIIGSPITDYYTGIGAAYSDTTVELRFRSAIDSVGSSFPTRTLTRQSVGPLPLNSELYLR